MPTAVAEARPSVARRLQQAAGSVRVRTTAAAVVVVGAAVVVAGLIMVALLQRSLASDVKASALARAGAAAVALVSGQDVAGIPVGNEDEEFVQVLDSRGAVVQASPRLAGKPAVVALSPGDVRRLKNLPQLSNDDPFLVVARAAGTPTGTFTVLVGRSLQSVNDASQAVTRFLVVGVPLMVVIVGLVAWRLVGRALSPVERMRADVEAISSRELHRRLPDPLGHDEIAGLAKTLNLMLARLEEGQLRQRRFVSDASHELRSPLAAIRQHAEVALGHPDGTTAAEVAGVVIEEEARLERLVEDLLLLAKIDEGSASRHREPVDLDDILFDQARRLRAMSRLVVDVSGVAAGQVSGDRGQLDKLVRNLADNAARHSRGKVALALDEGPGGVVLAVDDDGDGIPPADRERIFERFVRLDSARSSDAGGSGLGLAIVAEIAAAHGATVTAGDSALGGTRFTVRFPPPQA
ncbi:MAG TPA: ATP-binding protein [Actinomycetota bacterium]|nr:ATP-binding protein [Actinomycetota bacterium]